jgi:uroporphyrinogen decarboxylase
VKSRLDDLVPLVTHWGAPAKFSLYGTYGYVAFLEAVAVYPEAIEKIFWESGVLAREQNKVLAESIVELGLVPAVLCGDDICTGRGPMVSPAFLREKYWPHTKSALAPFVDAGIRLICHCDGNVMPLIDDFLDAGFTGFQGYQYEDGFDPYVVRQKALMHHANPIFLGGLSVTQTLPFGTDEDVRNDIDYLYQATDGGKGMILFTSNVSGVDVPPERLSRAYEYGRTLIPGGSVRRELKVWPWKKERPASR